MKKYFGMIMLFLTASIWGAAFVAQSVGMGYVGPFTFNFSRFLLGFLVLFPISFINILKIRKNKEKREKINIKKSICGGIICGVILAAASMFQQFGILYSDNVGKCGFITALYIVIVPVLYIFFGKKTNLFTWLSVSVALVGLFLLCVNPLMGFSPEICDILLIIAALLFSIHIMYIDSIIADCDGVSVSCVQFLICFIICFVIALFVEKPSLTNILSGWLPIGYAGILSCGIAYTFQIIGQKYVEPSKASLIMCLESVMSSLCGWLLLGQVMSLREICGCILVFAGIILAQCKRE